MDIRVLVPIAQGTEEMEAVIVIDMLRRAGIRVLVAAENNITTCSRGIKIIPDKLLSDLELTNEFDAIVLPGGKEGVENLCNNEVLQFLLKLHLDKDKIVAAVCAAPTILYDLKLLKKGTKLTSHPSVKKVFNSENYSEEKVVISENFITSRGAGTCFDFALELIKVLKGKAMSEKIKNEIVY